MSKNIFLIIISFWAFVQCKDDKVNNNNVNCTTCQNVREAKEYFAFKTGT